MKDFLEVINENSKLNEPMVNYDAIEAFKQTYVYNEIKKEYFILKDKLETTFNEFLQEHLNFRLESGDTDFKQSVDAMLGEFEMN